MSLGGEFALSLALHIASLRGELETVELLLRNGADPNVKGNTTFQTQLIPGAHQVLGGEYGTALQAASLGGEYQTVKLLLTCGADPNIEGEYTV